VVTAEAEGNRAVGLKHVKTYAAALKAGREIPQGWALDPAGHPTTDARAALAGSLLPFGGGRGANLALLVELLAAGLTGANWSKDAPAFNKGGESPGAGLFVLAVDPGRGGPSEKSPENFMARMADWISDVSADNGAYIPGLGKGEALHHARHRGFAVDAALWAEIKALG
jgi:(2R)-3-sulfolactate dehydrogenase (NADP+)